MKYVTKNEKEDYSMKNNYTKTEIRFFTVPELQKEQDYLRRQHQNGWKLLSVNFLGV